MTRSLIAAALVIVFSFVVSIALSIWITWSYVLPDFAGASTYLAPGLKFPLGTVRQALAEVPDRDPRALAARLDTPVRALDAAQRDAFFSKPHLSVPLDDGATFNLRVDEERDRAEAVVKLPDGRALAFDELAGMTPWQPETVALWAGSIVLAALGGSALILLPLARRLRRLELTARRLSAGELDARAPTGGPTHELASALNGMAERTGRLIRSHEELLQAVAHELRTPAARIRFQLELLESAADDDARRRRSEAIDRDLGELDELVSELLSFSRLGTDAARWPRAPLALVKTLDALAADADETGGAVTCAVTAREIAGHDTALMVEARAFRRAVRNLVANAMRAARTRVELSWSPAADGWLALHVDDDGAGIAPADRERLFAPFVVGDASRSRDAGGVGLGLAIVRRIVELHGGSVAIDTSPLGGARFTSTWPLAAGLPPGERRPVAT